MLLVGILICIFGLGIAGYFYVTRPLPPPHQRRAEVIPNAVENMPLIETIQLWGSLERGLPDGLGLEDQAYQNFREAYLRRLSVALFIAGVGFLVMIVSLFIPKIRIRSIPR